MTRATGGRRARRAGALLPVAALAGCVGTPAPPGPPLTAPVPADAPRFDPFAFFAGGSSGRGRLKVLFRPAVDVAVESRGRVEPDGTLVLDQRVREGAKPPRDRRWRLRRVGPGRYAGTLSDAAGPVSGEAAGNRLRLSFPMAHGFRVEQRLTLLPGGRAADNVLEVRRLGLKVAALHEVIRRR